MTTPKKSRPSAHSGHTDNGDIRDLKIERMGKVTIYKRGPSYCLYYREDGGSQRQKVDGNLAVAKASAAQVAAALAEKRPSPLGFQRTAPATFVTGYLDFVENVQGLAWRTVDRYRAALDRFLDFCTANNLKAIDAVKQATVEDLVRWLRGRTRTRNGSENGSRDAYKIGGIKFILSTCRTAFSWASRRRMLPPYAENPFTRFPIDQLRDSGVDEEEIKIFSPAQEKAFFAACSDWHKALFLPLATYGMRVGEWSHLLIENVDFKEGTIQICSKPEMFWQVKTARRRWLPITSEMTVLLKKMIGGRKAGFVLLNRPQFESTSHPADKFDSDEQLRKHLTKLVAELKVKNPQATKRDQRRAVTTFCRSLGQVPVKRVQSEVCKLTQKIACPDFTRTHDLRHLFATRAQETGINPIMVSQITGHRSLDMLKRYTHPSVAAKRQAMERMTPALPEPATTNLP